MLADLLTRPVTITRHTASGTVDDYGNDIPTVTTTETVGELQQRQRSEDATQAELSDSLWLLVLPAGTTLTTADVVTVGGQAFEVVGDPWRARNPRTGAESHVEATVRRTAGAGE